MKLRFGVLNTNLHKLERKAFGFKFSR